MMLHRRRTARRAALSAAVALLPLAAPTGPAAAQDGGADGREGVRLRIDFADRSGGDVRAWLAGKGFELERDADDPRRLALRFEDGALHLEARRPAFGLIYRAGDVAGVRNIRLRWGVLRFPEGASYERGVYDEALMVYVFFGHEKLPSGSLLMPDSPYFIGLYLCRPPDRVGHPYRGRHYEEGSRFVCLDRPEPGETVTSEFDLAAAFRAYFGRAEVPPISGLSLEVDTKESDGDGRAAAFIHGIELLD